MQNTITFLTVVGGLLFSVSCALLVEEVVFGALIKLFFPQPVVPVQVASISTQSRKQR